LKKLLQIVFFLLPFFALASHNRGGEITYLHLGGYTYEFTITTCTDVGPEAQADRNELYIDYGDGFLDTLIRDQIIPQPFNHQKNIYKGIHTFSSAGSYVICMQDPNRNNNILNINGGNSDTEVFSLQSLLVISPFLGNANNSVQFDECPCPAIACVGKIYCYNPQAVDPDNDSLSYELTAPFGSDCLPMGIQSTYLFPDDVAGGNLTLDAATGTVCWDSPGMIGEFNFTIKITEWRNGIRVGFVYRDIQLTVDGNCNNTPPTLTNPPQICVIAGENINFNVTANDVDGNTLSLTASGNPFSTPNSPATFPNVSGATSVTSNFNWNTNCTHIKPGTYNVLFAVQDNGDPVFSNYAQTVIKIIPPKVTGLQAAPFGNGVNLVWNASSCLEAEGYFVYRTVNPVGNTIDCCNSTDPEANGYTKIGTVFGNNVTNFYDNTSLTLGIDYCYTVTAFFNIGQVESCPSDTSCARLRKEVPILTHVTVNTTDAANGIDSIMWSKPSELDTVQFPGPYHYKVFSGLTLSNINTFIGQTASQNLLYQTDTTYTAIGLNTQDIPNYFRVELYYTNNGNDSLVGSSNSGGSVFVSAMPNDNEITLTWNEQVPWINSDYEIFRSNSSSGPFAFIGTTQTQKYTDTGLINGVNYCYYVKSIGHYSNTSIINPIENLSQIVCSSPIDLTPPCPPVLSIDGDCDLGENMLTWNNPNNSCADDVVAYNIYFTPVEGTPMTLIASINDATDTVFYHSNNGSIAGCYVVTALDSIQYNNESDSSNIVCFDNCPAYALPNVFSPNGDGLNDLYHAILPYRYVESIDIEIYNRWGQVVFATNDPDVNWDGKHKDSGVPVSDGVYYYLCTVNTIRLTGIEPIILKGFIHVFENTGQPAK
jgi:gliding motility-associated-like protein